MKNNVENGNMNMNCNMNNEELQCELENINIIHFRLFFIFFKAATDSFPLLLCPGSHVRSFTAASSLPFPLSVRRNLMKCRGRRRRRPSLHSTAPESGVCKDTSYSWEGLSSHTGISVRSICPEIACLPACTPAVVYIANWSGIHWK